MATKMRLKRITLRINLNCYTIITDLTISPKAGYKNKARQETMEI